MGFGLLSRVLGDGSTNISLKSLLFDAELSQGIPSQADTKTSIDPYSTQDITFPSRLSKGVPAQSCIFFKADYINNESRFLFICTILPSGGTIASCWE